MGNHGICVEQYDSETGKGQRTAHFLGWTSLVVKIMNMPEHVAITPTPGVTPDVTPDVTADADADPKTASPRKLPPRDLLIPLLVLILRKPQVSLPVLILRIPLMPILRLL